MKLTELFEADYDAPVPRSVGRGMSRQVAPDENDPSTVVFKSRSNVVPNKDGKDINIAFQCLVQSVRDLRRLRDKIPVEQQYQLHDLLNMMPQFPKRPPGKDWQSDVRKRHGIGGDVESLYGYV